MLMARSQLIQADHKRSTYGTTSLVRPLDGHVVIFIPLQAHNDLRYKKLAGTPDVTPRDDEATRKAMAKATGTRTTENTTTQPQEATASLI